MKKHKGNLLIEIIISIVCLMIVIIPFTDLLRNVKNEQKIYYENKKIMDIMYESKKNIEKAQSLSDIQTNYMIQDYNINVNLIKNFNSKIYKYEVVIKNEKDMQVVKYNIIKRYY